MMKYHPSPFRASVLVGLLGAALCLAPVHAADISDPGDDHANTSSAKSGDGAIEHERECRHDYDENGVVDFGDFLQLLSRWASWDPLTAEVTVTFDDIVSLLSEWGSC